MSYRKMTNGLKRTVGVVCCALAMLLCSGGWLTFAKGLDQVSETMPAAASPKIPVNATTAKVAQLPLAASVSVMSLPILRVRKEETPENYLSSEWLLVYLTGFLALATALLAGYTARLYTETRKLAADAKDTGDRSEKLSLAVAAAYRSAERAWVGEARIESRPLRVKQKDGTLSGGYLFTPSWLNTGRTPATNCRTNFKGLQVAQSADVPKFDGDSRPGHELRTTTLLPNVVVNAYTYFLTDSDIDKLKRLEIRVFLYGLVRYHDVFHLDGERHTEFCYEVAVLGNNVNPNKELQILQFSFAPIGAQNAAT